MPVIPLHDPFPCGVRNGQVTEGEIELAAVLLRDVLRVDVLGQRGENLVGRED